MAGVELEQFDHFRDFGFMCPPAACYGWSAMTATTSSVLSVTAHCGLFVGQKLVLGMSL
jgi:hypothetical protein